MPKTKAQKEIQLQDLTQNLEKSKAVFFADYKGMTMKQLSDLRNTLSDQDAELIITKNTLMKIALEQAGKPEADILTGPTATLFAYDDEITPIKALVKAIKDNSIGKVKAGILGNELLDEYSVVKLAGLPSKDELRGKTVGILVAPLQGIVGVLQANLRNLVYAISEIQKSKGGE